MRSTVAKVWAISAGLAGAIATGGIVVRAPVYISLCVVVLEAVSWCLWIERHPSS